MIETKLEGPDASGSKSESNFSSIGKDTSTALILSS